MLCDPPPTITEVKTHRQHFFISHIFSDTVGALTSPWPAVEVAGNNHKCQKLMPQELWINNLASSLLGGIILRHVPQSLHWLAVDLGFMSNLRNLFSLCICLKHILVFCSHAITISFHFYILDRCEIFIV